ncbi:MAG: single-stranded-DNA-specific exonuclease RecJ [Burkholderiaceae bacterium]|nr:single-stranded-DNA-specific exonuclease RecJ [Burkholderiaceae bacterium]
MQPYSAQPLIRQRPVDPATVETRTQAGIHPILARVFAGRNVRCVDDVDTGLDGLIAPMQMLHIQEAAQALADAIQTQQKLLIVADYDADGATACAVAVRGLRRFGARVDFIVPDRFVFGYGLTPALVDHAVDLHRDDPPGWIITVDNGISSIEGVARARALGLNVLVTDHHLPGKSLPQTLIVNPNQPGCPFPSKHLAGVGVMFYVLLALRAHLRDVLHWPAEKIPRLDDLLPIVALGTVADVVRLDTNNRRLVAQGLQRLRRGSAIAGLNALFQVANLSARDATVRDLGFAIGPRLNAAGRIADMRVGILCLLEDDPENAFELATALDTFNRERQEIESDARDAAIARAQTKLAEQSDAAGSGPSANTPATLGIVLHDPEWHQGVIGLIAGRLKERFYRPTIVFADDQDGERIKGSCRSIPGVHIRDVLERIDTCNPGLLMAFGGHAMAAGLTLAANDLKRFTEAFEATLKEFTDPADLQQILESDGPLQAEHMRLDIARLIAEQTWGQGFPPPIFVNEFEVLALRRLKEKHLRLTLRLRGSQTREMPRFEAIWFNAQSEPGACQRLAYRLGINDWQGRTAVQLEIVGLA